MNDKMTRERVAEIVAEMRAAMRRDEDGYRDAAFLDDMSGYIRDLEALLPPLPTLADMTQEERAACVRMQCDVAGVRGRWVVITPPEEDMLAGLISADEDTCWYLPERVTPRPDLPRLEWPGTEKPAPAPVPALPDGWRLADHKDHGRVIVTTPEPDSGGKVAFVRQNDFWDRKYSGDWCKPDELTYIDTEPEADQ